MNMYNNVSDGSTITIGNLELIVKISNINGINYYNLYYKDGSIYAANLSSLENIGITKINGLDISNYNYDVPQNNSPSYSNYNSNNSNNSNYNNASRNNLNESNTHNISKALGSLESTQDVVRYCTEVLEKANIAKNGIINTRESLENASIKGYGTEASISYFNLLTSAINIAKNNTEVTKEASIALNKLNICIKELLNKYIDKKKLEMELENLNKNKPEYRSWTDENNNRYDNQNEIDAWQAQVDEVNRKIALVNSEIENLKNSSDEQYRDISAKYGNLLNLDLEGVEVYNNTSSNTTKSVIDVTNGTFKENTFISSDGTEVDYYIYVPNVPNTTEEKLPVHLYLTGAGQDANTMLNRALPKELKNGSLNVGGIVVMPQTEVIGYNGGNAVYNYDASNGQNTSYHEALIELLDNVVEEYNGDKNRISVSGVSRGAENAYVLVGNHPDYFSAFIPISGSPVWIGNNRNQWQSISNTDVLVVHGTNDTTLPIDKHGPNRVYSKLNDLGLSNSNVSASVINGGSHGIDRDIFNSYIDINGQSQNIIEWAMSRTRT